MFYKETLELQNKFQIKLIESCNKFLIAFLKKSSEDDVFSL